MLYHHNNHPSITSPYQRNNLLINSLRRAVDLEADNVDMVEEHLVDMAAEVVIVAMRVEDVLLFPRQHCMEPFLQLVVKLPHSLEVVSQ
jgi:hypothetical protein